MQFQFLCPNRHLLEADVTQAGSQCQCPHCGILFVIPRAAQVPPELPVPGPDATAEPEVPEIIVGPQIDLNGPDDSVEAPPIIVQAEAEPAPSPAADEPSPPLHIICPKGHELETPVEMLGEEALCPYCKVRFQLRYEDSREYREKRARDQELREQRAGRLWLTWSIVAAMVVVGGMVVMIVAASR